jgi:2-oxoglutarate dehydrogenase complex dihydrolipoamide succinyltransferase (E2) component
VSSSRIEPTNPAASSAPRPGATGSQSVQVTMPQMGISVAEGTIIEWRKRPGDWVDADEVICEVTTDKVDVEIPAPASGRVERLLAEPGQTLAVGEVMAEIDPGASPGQAHPEEGSNRSSAGPAAEPQELDRSRFVSPVVRRIADENHIDLSQVDGTGVGGRVRKTDLLAFIDQGPEQTEGRPLHIESPYRPEPEPAANGAASNGEAQLAERREPMSTMRRQIARHMVESRRTAAHCTTIVEADFSRLAARRAELRDSMQRRGIRLTYLAFVARATVLALAEHPILNASVEDDEIVYHDDVNLGIAVALEEGLIVPVIQQAQRLSLEGTAAAINDLADRARKSELHPDDVHGGTFTITNPGQFGAVLATPIINQPQVAILDLEAVVKRPVVVEADGGDTIAIRPMSYLCMSWDHRALDGAVAARFLASVRERLEGGEVE